MLSELERLRACTRCYYPALRKFTLRDAYLIVLCVLCFVYSLCVSEYACISLLLLYFDIVDPMEAAMEFNEIYVEKISLSKYII